ncbi:LacI family DNA-binding transcriptional regulator [Propionimicrobium sp. PCR01-08-3]|uniref:LacI family DNA-binding transcriptional regulator n=1 Tax=Propionimicrobium sp. PCR01-08-3 TaxID=3052086 RepID=UPI00255CA8FB|nr:LacI family DNA-binding transcriptional regulator [Propionimicrobium sp. PCR01-08-3]WIY83673.1 LacI family DNA-binding transcriptional regulator [Propionimicrobium sp. PCR01-08-3]
MHRVRLVDVAEHAGVSRATASLVQRDSPLVAELTRERVRESMRELGYVYDRSAASLRSSRSGVVGLVAPELSHPYLTQFVTGAQEVLEADGVLVLAGVTHDDPAQQLRLITALAERKIDGVLVVPANGSGPDDLGDSAIPLVQLVREVPGVGRDFVASDNASGGYQIARHLLRHGAEQLSFVGGLAHFSSYLPRLEGVTRGLAEAGIAAPMQYPCEPTRGQAREAAARAIADGADALICYSDEIAFGALEAARHAGKKVPDDLLATGFDDVAEARHCDPSLTTVASSGETAGREAARLLLRRLADPDADPERIFVASALVVRASCGCKDATPAADDRQAQNQGTGQ